MKKLKKETRGAPKGNKNACGKRGRKKYFQIFGQRWSPETANKIKDFLEKTEQTQKEFLLKILKKYIGG